MKSNYINKIKGEYTFFAWVKGEYERYKKTIESLELQGYKLKKKDHDYLNAYEYYENDKGDIKVITECCL